MDSPALKASEIEAMTFIFTASVPGSRGGRGPWARLLHWAQQKINEHRRRDSHAMDAIDWCFPGL